MEGNQFLPVLSYIRDNLYIFSIFRIPTEPNEGIEWKPYTSKKQQWLHILGANKYKMKETQYSDRKQFWDKIIKTHVRQTQFCDIASKY